jgi:hypothetical protein
MALFGSTRDVNLMKSVSREFMEDIVSQQVGYYKIMLDKTKANLYGESANKYYVGPVLVYCLIARQDFGVNQEQFGRDVNRPVDFRFLRDHLVDANIYPEVGDVIMYNELYYLVDNVNENQLIVGKDNAYAYSTGLENYGSSYSIILNTHYASGESLGITKIVP